jgi:hypothetical protein
MNHAIASAATQVAAVRDDPAARLALMAHVFRGPTGRAPRHLPFRRAALSFMRWQAGRGVPDPLDASPPGSAWWRAVNECLLRDGFETVALLAGLRASRHRRPCSSGWSSPRDRRAATGTGRTTRASWRHISSTGTSRKTRGEPERFFMNVALRVLSARTGRGALHRRGARRATDRTRHEGALSQAALNSRSMVGYTMRCRNGAIASM